MNTITKKDIKEVVIEIDSTLEFENPVKIPWHFKANEGESEEETLERYKNSQKDNFNKAITKKSSENGLELVRDCIGGDLRHMGYLGYLEQSWRNHIGIILTPDIFWQIFLTEVATHIKANAENYRSLFTDSDEKKEIIVMTGDPQLIDLRLIANELLKLTPTNTEMFLPEFTTTTFEASMAFKAAFADAMSPYYDYSMLLCGFPKIKLLGEESDWDKVIENINSFGEVIALPDYFEKVTNLAQRIKSNISNPDKKFWNEMFSLKKCGSGSQVELNGWITKLYIDRPRIPYVHNYPASLSFVKYKFINTGQNFELCYGLFSSNIEDGYLIPEFGYIINEIK
jgi:hypothetical protein